MTSHPAFPGIFSTKRGRLLLCVLALTCAACTAEEVSFRTGQPLVTASGVELEMTLVDGQLKAKGERLVVVDEDRRMRLEGDASLTLERNDEHAGVEERTLFTARARQIEIDPAASVIQLKGAVHTRFSGIVQTDADAEL